jgi:hypothetical protein
MIHLAARFTFSQPLTLSAFVDRRGVLLARAAVDGLLLPVPGVDRVPSASICVNVAVTERSAFIETWQVPAPEHPDPLQPANAEPTAGVALSATVAVWS